jgi:hypothetical protein
MADVAFDNVVVPGTNFAVATVIAVGIAVPVSTGVTVTVSAVVAAELIVAVIVNVTAVPTAPVASAESVTIAVPVEAAVDGTTATRLRPNAATATSAMRLKVVFVDICFLSISR